METDIAMGYLILGIAIIVVLLAIIAIVMMSSLYVLQMRRNEEEALGEIEDKLASAKEQRIALASQMLSMFGAGNSQSEAVKAAIDMSSQVSGEAGEKAWESRFLPLMKKFLAEAKANLSPQMREPFKMSVKTFSENEKAIKSLSERIDMAHVDMQRYERFPLSAGLSLARFFSAFTKNSVEKYDEVKDGYDNLKENASRYARPPVDDGFVDEGLDGSRQAEPEDEFEDA